MQLDQILKIEFINANMTAKNKEEALAEMVNTIIQAGVRVNVSEIMNVLKQRESLGSTGIGDGMAIPHGKVADLNDIVVAFGRSLGGLNITLSTANPCICFFCFWHRRILQVSTSKSWPKYPKCSRM